MFLRYHDFIVITFFLYFCFCTILGKTFADFSLFSIISLHHKLNGTRLLSPESECTSCLTCRRNFKKIPKMLGFDGEYPAIYPKAKFSRWSVKNCKKTSCKTFHRKPTLPNFVNLSITLCPRLYLETFKSEWFFNFLPVR